MQYTTWIIISPPLCPAGHYITHRTLLTRLRYPSDFYFYLGIYQLQKGLVYNETDYCWSYYTFFSAVPTLYHWKMDRGGRQLVPGARNHNTAQPEVVADVVLRWQFAVHTVCAAAVLPPARFSPRHVCHV